MEIPKLELLDGVPAETKGGSESAAAAPTGAKKGLKEEDDRRSLQGAVDELTPRE